jgi:protein-disulfide isomerase
MYATDVAREVDEKYIETGLVRFVHWDLPLSAHGYPAIITAEASHCAGEQGAYWEMHYGLFDNWKALSEVDSEDEEASIEAVLDLTGDLVDDPDALALCIEQQKYRPVVATMLRQALDMEVNVTPAFLIQSSFAGNDHVESKLGFLPYDEFSALLDQELSRAKGTPIPTRTPAPTPAPTPDPADEEAAEEEEGSDEG